MIFILSIFQDLHALTVQRHVREAGRTECHVIECDRIAQRDFMGYGVNYLIGNRILTSEGFHVSLCDSDVVWLRTASSHQILDFPVEDEGAKVIIDSDSVGGLTGLLASHFHGKWISTREATYRAADKIGQLQAAHESGFRVPRTLVSQSRDDVVALYESCAGAIIVKTIVGAPGPLLQTVKLDNPAASDAATFAAAPAIYQEYIQGCDHLRLNCFGDRSFAALIRTDDLDWRVNLNVPITSYPVPPSLHHRVRTVLDRLGLEMGIVDLKLTPGGEPVWLEVNPQGQFLFLDALTDLHLAERFTDYLIDEHAIAQLHRSRPSDVSEVPRPKDLFRRSFSL